MCLVNSIDVVPILLTGFSDVFRSPSLKREMSRLFYRTFFNKFAISVYADDIIIQ